MSSYITAEQWAEVEALGKQYDEFTRQALEALATGIDKPDVMERFLDADAKAGAAMVGIKQILGA